MKYVFVGKKVPHVGKTLWEIVGNLKNFGVGRLVRKSMYSLYPEPSFFKIIRVQPLPPDENKFESRRVMVWAEEFFKGAKFNRRFLKSSELAQFQLIPKIEEEKYLQAAEQAEPKVKYFKKYCTWPPLYKILWEKENPETPLPKLNIKRKERPEIQIIEIEEEEEPSKSSLYKGELSVHDMYLEIVHLKQLIKAHKNAQNEFHWAPRNSAPEFTFIYSHCLDIKKLNDDLLWFFNQL